VPTKLARLLLVLAVVLAVPLQAVAALGAAQCMADAHHEPADAHGDAGESLCGPCAACCASASIVAFLSPAAASPAAAEVAPPVPGFHPGAPPDLLERPPLFSDA
jgi:hypothetical protein